MKGMLTRFQHTPALLVPVILALASYRIPMPVTELKVFPECHCQPAYYVCPRCRLTVEREFMNFCDRCGQRLDWRNYANAKILYVYSHFRPGS